MTVISFQEIKDKTALVILEYWGIFFFHASELLVWGVFQIFFFFLVKEILLCKTFVLNSERHTVA